MTARITIHLTPRAARTTIDGWKGRVLHARVTTAPVDGKANIALVKLLARALRIAPSRITIVSGASSRTKILEIDEMDTDALRAALPGQERARSD